MKPRAEWFVVDVELKDLLHAKQDNVGNRIMLLAPDDTEKVVGRCVLKAVSGSIVVTSDSLDMFVIQLLGERDKILYKGRLSPQASVIEQKEWLPLEHDNPFIRFMGYRLV